MALLSAGCSDASEKELSGTPIEKGGQLYQVHCIRCHGSGGRKGASGAKNLNESKLGRAQIIDIVRGGKGVMPSYKNTIKGDSSYIWLTEYVITLRK